MAEKTYDISAIYLKNGKAVAGFHGENACGRCVGYSEPLAILQGAQNNGDRAAMVFDLSETDEEHEQAIAKLRLLCGMVQLPVYAAGAIHRLEDVKKLLYAGCARVFLNYEKESNYEMLREASERFGREKIGVFLSWRITDTEELERLEKYASMILVSDKNSGMAADFPAMPVLLNHEEGERCTEVHVPEKEYRSPVSWQELKKGSDGLVPCIVQDWENGEVLMMAWMNEEAWEKTLDSGVMTYWSRSRRELWKKGETSGHYQYLKSLSVDCDSDTLLAQVAQVGAACHTGNRSCFYRELIRTAQKDTDPQTVLEEVYRVIQDRKKNPKEGSYTNYLFDKGIDKILKKVGEEAAEIIIAAKNPDPVESVYEMSDFLYHMMVLMAEKGLNWQDITDELARRH